jgi:methionyl-tRNA formyltransferase
VKLAPVHAFAEGLGLPVRTPASMRDPAEIEAFAALGPGRGGGGGLRADPAQGGAGGAAAGLLQPPRLAAAALAGRGAHPAGADGGRRLHRRAGDAHDRGAGRGAGAAVGDGAIAFDDTAGTLHDKMALAGRRLLPRALAALERGDAAETPQAAEGVTYAKKIKPAEARIDWSRPGPEVDRHIRGLSPFPGAWFEAPRDRGPVRVKALMSAVSPAPGVPARCWTTGC